MLESKKFLSENANCRFLGIFILSPSIDSIFKPKRMSLINPIYTKITKKKFSKEEAGHNAKIKAEWWSFEDRWFRFKL